MSVRANFDLPVNIDIEVPLINQETGDFENHDLTMKARLIRAEEGRKLFEGSDEIMICDVLTHYVTSPPQILNEKDEPYTLEDLIDIPYLRNTMYQRIVAVSFDPQAARGNSKPQ